jgi:nitrogenase molybdenum-iron protein beta chain
MSNNFIERPRYICSLGGALSTISALPETIPVLHAAAGCAGSVAWGQNGGSGLQVGGYCGGLSVPSSNVQDREVVFGCETRLREQIKNTLDVIEGKLYFVITGCVTEVIGDDVKSAVKDFQDEGVNIISAETGGFKGNSYYGYDIAMQSLIKNFIDRKPEKVKGKVNVFGIVPYMDAFWRGNLEGIRVLLEKLGLTVNTFFTDSDTLEKIKDAGDAELNIVVSDIYGVEAAETFEDLHGVPFIKTGLPVGPSASDEFLRKVSGKLSLDSGFVDDIIKEENSKYFKFLAPLIECYNDLDLQRYTVVVGDVNYAVSITKFLSNDLGWLPELVVFTDQLIDEQKAHLNSVFNSLESGLKPKVVFETDSSEVIRYLNEIYPKLGNNNYLNTFSPGFVVGSSLDRELALSIGAPHLTVSFPVANRAVINRGYTGYKGGLTLSEDLISSIIAGR